MNSTVTLSSHLMTAVDQLAKRLGITRRDLVRKAVERFLEQECAKLPAMSSASKHDDEEW